ncbi:fas-associated death domain protein [Plodia interpunctella]|uniref:fas-associated death domain protein n=1 Tax=Plodia interpunctella TaxID=58824 RepID=UPI002368E7D5|nr:fas-associated death domain protein [Plodia interpunctella]
MTVSEYSLIKQKIMLCVSSTDRMNQTIDELKQYFQNTINSPRRLERIKTIGQLLHVLETRDHLSESNVYSLKHIAQFVNDQELLNKINAYERFCHTRKDLEYTASTSQKVPFKSLANGNPYNNLSDRKIQRIHQTIVEQIGTYWRDLARNLKIRQCEIDNIDKDSISLQSKAEKILEMYMEKADTQKWFLDLCESLEKARRRDMARTLNHIFVMNI